MNDINQKIKTTNKTIRKNGVTISNVSSGKIANDTIYITENFGLEPIDILDLMYEGKSIKQYLDERISYGQTADKLDEDIRKACDKHDVDLLSDIKTSKSHIPLILELNNTKHITKASINYNTKFLNDKSEIPPTINKGVFRLIDDEFVEDKTKILMTKEII